RHATLVTGVSPARYGIVAHSTLDPLGRNLGGWYWYPEHIRVPTLWDVAAEAGLVTASVDWPATVGARITHNIVQYWRTKGADAPDDAKLKRVLSTPGLLAEAERALGPYPAGDAYTVQEDRRRTAFNVYLLQTRRPRLHFAYFSGLDEEQHESGPGSAKALAVLEATAHLRDPHATAARQAVADVLARLAALPDSPIQRVLDGPAAQAAGAFPDAAFVVAAKPGVRIDGRMEGDVLQPGLPRGTHGLLPE